MTPLVVSINAEADIASAAQVMRSNQVGFLPVRRDGRLVGVVTDRDITVRAAAPGFDVERTRVGEVMTPGVVTVEEARDTKEVFETMKRERVSRLMVVDHRDRLVGVLSVRDIPRAAL
jgi:CBS domain-containing protein